AALRTEAHKGRAIFAVANQWRVIPISHRPSSAPAPYACEMGNKRRPHRYPPRRRRNRACPHHRTASGNDAAAISRAAGGASSARWAVVAEVLAEAVAVAALVQL